MAEGSATVALRTAAELGHRIRYAKAVFVWADSFWERNGQNGDLYAETGLIGGSWTQREGIMSTPGGARALWALPGHSGGGARGHADRRDRRAYGEQARAPQAFFVRRWGADPWTRGYITAWRPGDVMAIGPLHATHEPPFYVCGSDQWVCGYMEGAVRTGSGAAEAALCR